MRFVFYDVDEEKMEIITDILADNNIRYTLDYDVCYGPFGPNECNFDIIINVEYEMWEYLKWQVQNKFNQLNKLENDYKLKATKHPPLISEKKKKNRKKKNEKKNEINCYSDIEYLYSSIIDPRHISIIINRGEDGNDK